MTITVFGLGFVGLTTALGFCEKGNTVHGIDVNAQRVALYKGGNIPFVEPHLQEALQRHVDKRFFVSDDPQTAVAESDVVFLCVGTPCGQDGAADLSHLFSAIDSALPFVDTPKVFVVKSTVPPSTTSSRVAPYIRARNEKIRIANNPEFLREGFCYDDFMHPDRIVVGTDDADAFAILQTLYEPFDAPVIQVTPNGGEYIKYLSNSLLATMISYANEMAMIGHQIGDIDVGATFRALLADKRWADGSMAKYAYPGCGYGGYCLPKDTSALLAMARQHGVEPNILRSVIAQNDAMPQLIAERIMAQTTPAQRIGILGLSFKPHSDDVRSSVSAPIIQHLLEAGYRDVVAHDPYANDAFAALYALPITYAEQIEAMHADAYVILTAWPAFASFKANADRLVLDYRYMSDAAVES